MDHGTWDYSAHWEETYSQLRQAISDEQFAMWVQKLQYLRSERETIILTAPSNFYRDSFKQRFLPQTIKILHEISGSSIKIDFEIGAITKTEIKKEPEPVKSFLQNIEPEIVKSKNHPNLNVDYTFDNFVISENNEFAANAALGISKNPGKSYNPCLIYGGVGLGKTHILQAIGNAVYSSSPNKKILYISMENFINDFVTLVSSNNMPKFKEKYRNIDVLLIDDIHFISKKAAVQEELFFTFEALFHNSKQMVFSCDRPLSEIKDISDRLRSRFQRGVIVDLLPPSYEVRLAILHKKCQVWGIQVPEESLKIISETVTTNVRDLEAAFITVKSYADLVSKSVITPELTKERMKNLYSNVSVERTVSIDTILKTVADYFNLTSSDMKGKKRTATIVLPRQIAMYITREITEFSTTEIGLEFGGRDHTTVMHAVNSVGNRIKTDSTIEPIIRTLIKQIKNEGTKG